MVFGGLIVAQISRFLGTVFPGPGCVWSKLTVNFRAPLLVGRTAALKLHRSYGNDDLGIWELALAVSEGDTLVADGSVQVARRTERD